MGAGLGCDFTMAFQPIVNTTTKQIFAQEALTRGINNEPAAHLFTPINEHNRYRFDQSCRIKAIQLAAKLGVNSLLSINFMPNAVYRPELCINTTLAAAELYNFPINRIIFEFTEDEKSRIMPMCVTLSSTTGNVASRQPLTILARATRA